MAIKVQNTTVVNDSRQILNVTGLTMTGNVTATGSIDAGTQFLGQLNDTVGVPSFAWTGDTNTGMFHPVSDTISVSVGGNEIVRISNTGISIGTSANSSYGLSIRDDNGFTIATVSASDSADPGVRMFRYRGSVTAPTPVTTNSALGGLRFFGSQNTSPTQGFVLSAAIDAYAAETFSAATRASYINFRTTNISSLTATEKMRISANGNVGIGTTDPEVLLHVAGGGPTATKIRLSGGNGQEVFDANNSGIYNIT